MKMQQQRKSRAERSQPALENARIFARFRLPGSCSFAFFPFSTFYAFWGVELLSFCKLPSDFSLNFPLQGSRKRTKRTETETETAMVVQNRVFPRGGVKILEQGVSKHTAAANSIRRRSLRKSKAAKSGERRYICMVFAVAAVVVAALLHHHRYSFASVLVLGISFSFSSLPLSLSPSLSLSLAKNRIKTNAVRRIIGFRYFSSRQSCIFFALFIDIN